MKSLFIFNDFPPILGGQATYFYFLCKALPPEAFVILAPKVGNCRELDNAEKYTIVRRRYLFKVPILEKFAKIIIPFFHALVLMRRYRVSRLHCGHVLSTGIIGLCCKKLLGKPYFIYTFAADVMGFQKYPLLKLLLKAILHNAERVMSISDYTGLRLQELGVEQRNIVVVYPRIDIEAFSTSADPRGIRTELNIGDNPLLLSVNRLIKRKGNDRVIEALPVVLKKIPRLRYVVVGDGEYLPVLKELAVRYGVEQAVVFVSASRFKGREGSFYAACDVFIMASRILEEEGDAEGFGIVFFEAAALSKPVIGGNSGGIPEAVIDNETGILVDPNSCDSIAQGIIRLFTDKPFAEKLASSGYQRVKNNYDWHAGVPELEPFVV